MENNKLILPISILLGCIVLGGFYYAGEVNKQQSIEKQQQIELKVKTEADQAQIAQDQADKEAQAEADQIKADQAQTDRQAQQDAIQQAKTTRQIELSACLNQADTDYWSFMRLNGTETNGVINALTRFWDSADKQKQTDIDNCYKRYPQN